MLTGSFLGGLRNHIAAQAAFLVQPHYCGFAGRRRILDIQPERLHQRVPVILGSKREVERVISDHAA